MQHEQIVKIIKKTRFPELNYSFEAAKGLNVLDGGFWSIIDSISGDMIGSTYTTETDLLCDLERVAIFKGYATPPLAYKDVLACDLMVYYNVYRTYLMDNILADDSDRITVESLIDFVNDHIYELEANGAKIIKVN